MDHFVSPPILLTDFQASGGFTAADLIFYEVDARGLSFTARVFLDEPERAPDLAPGRVAGYAGFFTIFGHGGCFGDEGHCDVPAQRDPFDTGPPHALTPQTKMVDVSDRLRQIDSDHVVVTVLAVRPSEDGGRLADVMSFSGINLLSYAA